MATKTIDAGKYGRWRIIVDQVSQSASSNTSKVRVRGVLINDGTSKAFNNNGVSVSVTGTSSWSGTAPFSVPPGGGTDTVIDRTFTVSHASDGTKTVTYGVSMGATGTTVFGTPGKVTVSLTLDRLANSPGKTPTPSRSFSAPNTVNLSWSAADANNSSITDYYVQYSKSSTFASGVTTVDRNTNRSATISGLDIGTTWYFRVRAKNAIGYGDYSNTVSYAIPDVPSAPPQPAVTLTLPRTITVSWNAPDSGGASILEYQVAPWGGEYTSTGTNRSFSQTVSNGDSVRYQVRARNSQGWGPWCAATPALTVPNVPGAPQNVSSSYISPTQTKVTWSGPASDGGAAVSKYEMQYADNSGFSGATTLDPGASGQYIVTIPEPGKTYYFRFRAYNSQGWGPWSSADSELSVSGPRVKVDGVWRSTIAYVKVDGVWRTAIPYVKVDGVWRLAGG